MPLTVSTSARDLSAFGASHLLLYQRRICSRTLGSVTLNGSRLCGRIGDLISSYGTSAGDPQKSQRWPTRAGSNTDTALQLRHCTVRRSVCQPRSSSGISRSARTRSSSSICPAAVTLYGDSVPQNGHTSFCLPGLHSACAPQAGHGCFSVAVTANDCPITRSPDYPITRLPDYPITRLPDFTWRDIRPARSA